MGLPNDNNNNSNDNNNDNNNNKLKTTGLLDNNTAPTLTMPAPASLVNTVDCMPALKALNSFDRIGAKRLPNFIISIIEAMVAPCLLSLGHSSRDLSSLLWQPPATSCVQNWESGTDSSPTQSTVA